MRVVSVVVVVLLVLLAIFGWRTMRRDEPLRTDERPRIETPSIEPTRTEPLASLDAPATRQLASAADEAVAATLAATDTSGPRCRIHGRMVDTSARPIPDVSLALFPVGGVAWSTHGELPKVGSGDHRHERLETKTGADGTFVFEAPLPTADWVAMRGEPAVHFGVFERNFGPSSKPDRPRIVAGDNDLGDIPLTACGAIEGRVRAEDGTPLKGASVSAAFGMGVDGYSNATTDAAGRFVLGHILPGQVECDVRMDGWISKKAQPVVVRVSVTVPVDDVVLSRASEIGGIVVDQDGHPAAGVRIWGWPQNGGQGAGATTRDDGTFTVYLPQTEPYSFEINRAKEFEPWGGRRAVPDCTFEPGRKDVRIVLTRASIVTFRVVDAVTRTPIETFSVALDEKLPPNTYRSRFQRAGAPESHPDGVVTMSASVAKHDVVVQAPDHAPFEGSIVLDTGSSDTATIALAPAASLRGRFVRADAPAKDMVATVQRETLTADGKAAEFLGGMGSRLRSDVGEFAGRARTVTTGDDGLFVFGELPGGTYALTVKGTGVAPQSWRLLKVPQAGVLEVGDLALGAEAILSGRLVTPPGVSPVGYTVQVGERFDNEFGITDPSGTFRIAGLAAGPHVVTWLRPGENGFMTQPRSPRAIDVDLAAGREQELTIDTTRFEPATVRVRVLRGGRPATGVRVRGEIHPRGDAVSATYTSEMPTVDADGRAEFRIDGESHFDLVVVGLDDGPRLATIPDLDAVAGQVHEFVVELHVGSLRLELPAALSTPDPSWSLRVVLSQTGARPTYFQAVPQTKGRATGNRSVWSGAIVDLGEARAGTYEATVSFSRLVDAPGGQRKFEPLRPPFTTTITIEEGDVARLVVP